jgi:ERF superfamily
MNEPVADDGVDPTSPPVPGEIVGDQAPAVLSPRFPGTPDLADPMLALIERAVRDPAVDLSKLEGLMQLRERMEDRRAKQAFDNAIAQAKGAIPTIVKNRSVDYTTAKGRTAYRYEDFAAVAATVDPVLARHGLSYRFRSAQEGPRLKVTCRVSHADGYGEDTSLEAVTDTSGSKNDLQAIGSAVTYLQRYTLKLALGLAASNDDDAQSFGATSEVDADMIAYVEQAVRDTMSDEAKFLKAIGASSTAAMTLAQYKRAVTLLAEKKRRMQSAS